MTFFCYRINCSTNEYEVFVQGSWILNTNCIVGKDWVNDPVFLQERMRQIALTNPWGITGPIIEPCSTGTTKIIKYAEAPCQKVVWVNQGGNPTVYGLMILGCDSKIGCQRVVEVCWDYSVTPALLKVANISASRVTPPECPDNNPTVFVYLPRPGLHQTGDIYEDCNAVVNCP